MKISNKEVMEKQAEIYICLYFKRGVHTKSKNVESQNNNKIINNISTKPTLILC